MDISKKEQKQNAGDNAVQTQIENQHNYFINNNFQIKFTQGDTSKEMVSTDVDNGLFNNTSEKNNTTTTTTYQKEVEKKWRLVQETNLWKTTLGKNDENVSPLRESFLDAREKTIFLLDKIKVDFPNLTMHDITHVDSLWNVADTIIGEDYPMNPLEGYVLGIAFLIHDAALSYDAVGGKEKLRDTIEWKDAYADGAEDEDEEEFKKECDFVAIRALHAKFAEKLLFQAFEKDNGTTFYIIDNYSFRTHFGNLIGKIAASHHWSIDDVETELEKPTNPLNEMPREWKVNARKLACILRCADAGHIDNGRAPDSIYQSLAINGVSRQHWESQNHLCQVCADEFDPTKLCITSSNPYLKDDFSAWNVTYDAVRLFDEEIKKSNDLLKKITPREAKSLEFPHKSILGVESKETLAKYIETEGWVPCDFGVHTSNMKALIENFGGSNLYGEDNMLLIALRELIQNARDAIHARRTLDDYFKDGGITVQLKEEDGKRWIEVVDDGIGMSLNCIKHNLLDFGSSYWNSSLSKFENPGLWSKGFKSIGMFGIGFYSVFMVAKSVEVITRRYNDGDNATKIEFPEGLTLSPIMSDVKLNPSVSTIVKFVLKDNVKLTFDFAIYSHRVMNLERVLPLLVVGLDVNVYYGNSSDTHICHKDINSPLFNKTEWLKNLLFPCPINIENLASQLEFLEDEVGNKRGLVLPPECRVELEKTSEFLYNLPNLNTIGGLLTSFHSYRDNGYIGYIDGKKFGISRNRMIIDEYLKRCLLDWIKKKYQNKFVDLLHIPALAKEYCYLIDYCDLKKDIVNDNIIQLYSKLHDITKVGSFYTFMDVHLRLFIGVYKGAGIIRYFDEEEDIKNEIIETIDNDKISLQAVESLIESDLKELMIHEEIIPSEVYFWSQLFQVFRLPASTYEEIIYKFYLLSGFRIWEFEDQEFVALRVWVNLIINKQMGKMINWTEVDTEVFAKLIAKKNDYKELVDYLLKFMIPTHEYLLKIGALSK